MFTIANALYLASAAIGVVVLVLLLGYIIYLHKRLKKLETRYTFFMQDEDGKSVEMKLRDDVAKLHDLQGTLNMIHQRQKDILSVQNNCFRKIGFVKYNAFDNIGNNLSFAFTVLDGKNNGFCLSSVYGRTESRIFAKPIVEGKCLYGMSDEEKESLQNALHYQSDMTDEEIEQSASTTVPAPKKKKK